MKISTIILIFLLGLVVLGGIVFYVYSSKSTDNKLQVMNKIESTVNSSLTQNQSNTSKISQSSTNPASNSSSDFNSNNSTSSSSSSSGGMDQIENAINQKFR